MKLVKTRGLSIEVNPLFFLVVLITIFFNFFLEFLAVFSSVLLHELGHILTAKRLKYNIYYIKILPVGMNAGIDQIYHDRLSQILVYISGPLVNILLFTLCTSVSFFTSLQSVLINNFMITNIYLAVFNLMPVLPMDGGKVLREVFAAYIGLLSARNYLRVISVFFAFSIILLGILHLYKGGINFSLLLIGIYIIFSLKSEETEAALMNIKHVVYRRSRLLKKGVYPARDLVVIKNMHIGEIIKNMDFDRFHFIHVLDEDLRLIKVLTEQEIIDGILKYSVDMTFDELIAKAGLTGKL